MSKILTALGVLALVSVSHVNAQIPGVNADFISSLSKAMGSGVTTAQAEGAAGAIFGLAKSRLSPADFTKISGVVPGMDALLRAAPAAEAAVGTTGATAGLAGATAGLAGATAAATGLSSLAGAFNKLGLAPDQIQKAIPIVTEYVTKSGGADVGNRLAGVLK